MAKRRILLISQEISPYLPASPASSLGKALPHGLHANKFEVRTFMPRYGTVNERRNQLHEVIRLSGMNIPINDNDHPLILKVASLQPARIQVYFIDNDDYFQKLDSDIDPVGSDRPDNDERAIFFARGTTETIKKLRWEPEIIQCNGWMTALSPIYLRKMFTTDPSFSNTKVVYAVTPDKLSAPLDPEILRKIKEDGFSAKSLAPFKDTTPDTDLLHKIGISFADAVIFNDDPSESLLEFVKESGKPFTIIPEKNQDPQPYIDFYNSLAQTDQDED